MKIKKESWIKYRRADLMSKTSDAEKCAYNIISSLGYQVIKQLPIDTGRRVYFADLYIPALRCVVEIDGGYHSTSEQRRLDRNRSSGIRRKGLHVLRLSNRDARSVEKIKKKIARLLKK